MKRLFRGIFLAYFIVILTGCIGEEYDFTPPTVTLNDSSSLKNLVELAEANIDWRGEEGEPLTKETEDAFAFAKDQTPVSISSGQKVDIEFGSQDFAVEELEVSMWKQDEEMKLDVMDGRSFYFPEEKGEYVIVLDLRSDRGKAQYVGNAVVQ
ncbi:hypothetical protein M3182_08085 [Mesobacillus maritimus]|uniref:hypothetical protein n=1 Tax=Mesobacillus maritimus TaxID=1643336 RepID=UPI0020422BDA|nr:hypothetical protein [Mesobacillus maritimus]MCM3585708.1 hypothetical protein [Mesobacillus maritimus]